MPFLNKDLLALWVIPDTSGIQKIHLDFWQQSGCIRGSVQLSKSYWALIKRADNVNALFTQNPSPPGLPLALRYLKLLSSRIPDNGEDIELSKSSIVWHRLVSSAIGMILVFITSLFLPWREVVFLDVSYITTELNYAILLRTLRLKSAKHTAVHRFRYSPAVDGGCLLRQFFLLPTPQFDSLYG